MFSFKLRMTRKISLYNNDGQVGDVMAYVST